MAGREQGTPADPEDLGLDAAATLDDLASCLRALRRRHARQNADTTLTYRELAAKSGYALGAISDYFNAKVLPSTDRLEVLSALMGASARERGRFATVRDLIEENDRLHSEPAHPEPVEVVPRQLPMATRHFVGRTEEIRSLTTAAGVKESGVSVFAIDGMAGVGKTALAVHIGHLVEDRFPDGQLYIELNTHSPGVPPRTACEALEIALIALGVPPKAVPKQLDARAAKYRQSLAGTRTLIVLDDVADESQVGPLLPASAGCLVLVTTRMRLKALDDAEVLSLDLLSRDEALALFCKTGGADRVSPADPLLLDVVRRCGYLPLAIRVVAAVFKHRRAWSLEGLVEKLQDRHAGFDLFQDGSRSVAAALDLSYAHLSGDLKAMFRSLGQVPGLDLDVFAAAALMDADLGPTERLLQELVDRNLLTEVTLGRYRLHDLLREHARAKVAEEVDAVDRDTTVDRLLNYYQHTAEQANGHLEARIRAHPDLAPAPAAAPRHSPALADRQHAEAWLGAEADNLIAAARHSLTRPQPNHPVTQYAALSEYWRSHGPWAQAIELHMAAGRAADALGDSLGHAGALKDLGVVRFLIGDYPDAEDAQLQALALYQELGNQTGQAMALNELGAVRHLLGDYPGAEDAQLQALALYQELGNRNGQATALSDLGTLRYLTGDYPGAEDALQRALALHQELGNRRGRAIALNELAAVRRLLGDYPGAEAALQQAQAVYEELGNRNGQATALSDLGTLRYLIGDYPGAEDALQRALALHQELGSPTGQAIALSELGTVRRLVGNYPDAEDAHREALVLFRGLGERGNEAWALTCYAALPLASGDVTRALELYRQALVMTREVQQPDDEAVALEGIGECLLRTGQERDAAAYLREALEIFQRLGMRPDAQRVAGRMVEMAE